MNRDKTVCLNMIVKDEADIIVETLKNITEKIKIDYWVICDTGSSDNTKELITNFFKDKNINGELYSDQWEDFAYNRTKALEYAYNKTDFLFIFDADDKIDGELILPDLEEGYAYYIQIGKYTKWQRLCLIDNHIKWYYKGVIHEVIYTDEICKTLSICGDYNVIPNTALGARTKKGDKKYYDDARILEKAYEKEEDVSLKDRYAFYTANSYKDSGDNNMAIKWYKIVVETGNNWVQEKYWSCYQLGLLYKHLGENEKSLYWFFISYEFDTTRQESLYELIRNCRIGEKYKSGYALYKMINPLDCGRNEKLFAIDNIYDFLIYSEMIIIFYYLRKFEEAIELFKKVFSLDKMLGITANDINNNIQYFIPYIKKTDLEFYEKIKLYSRKNFIDGEFLDKIHKIFDRKK